jgi:hypothetical protein
MSNLDINCDVRNSKKKKNTPTQVGQKHETVQLIISTVKSYSLNFTVKSKIYLYVRCTAIRKTVHHDSVGLFQPTYHCFTSAVIPRRSLCLHVVESPIRTPLEKQMSFFFCDMSFWAHICTKEFIAAEIYSEPKEAK